MTGAGTVTDSLTDTELSCESISQRLHLHCTEPGSVIRSWSQGWDFFLFFLVLAILEPSHLEAG